MPRNRPIRPGVEEWTNPNNGLTVVRVHYTADPAKRDPAWAATEKRNYPPRGWRREYEIDWAAPAGEPVIPEYDPATHLDGDLVVDPSLRLLRFWDFGFVSPVVLFAQITEWDQLRFLRELCPFNTPLNQLIPMVKAVTQEILPLARTFDSGDPAATSHTDLGSASEVLSQAEHGIHLHVNRPGTEVSYANFRKRFLRRVMRPGYGSVPAVVINGQGCPNFHEALAGAFHLSENPPYKPVRVHPFTDVVDAARYGHDNLSQANREYQESMSKMAMADCSW